MELTQEDKAILAHVVIDPDEWVAHALKIVGEQAVTEKIETHRDGYLYYKNLKGYVYETRAEREASGNGLPVKPYGDLPTWR